MRLFFTLSLILTSCLVALGQKSAVFISGNVIDARSEEPIEFVVVSIKGTSRAVETNQAGTYVIKVPAGERTTLVYNRTGYKSYEKILDSPTNDRQIDLQMVPLDLDIEVVVEEKRIDERGMIKENVQELLLLPSASGNLESVLPHIALGTSGGTGGELSSQYNVRGGNYDENLVYVNDFEIYRPQLIRSSQQEGLSFANIDLIRDLSFSSGGFQARYGDKMSSVLDIKYKRPDSTRASVGMSLLGGSAHIEGSKKLGDSDFKRFRYLVGARYKTTRYLLGSLDVKGEYLPKFADVQTYLTYDISRALQLGVLANYNRSFFEFEPESGGEAFGLWNLKLKLISDFEGKEIDDFETGMGGLSLTWIPEHRKHPFYLKLMASSFQAREKEAFDIINTYRLSEIDISTSENNGQEVALYGQGVQHQFTRNYLQSNVTNVQVKGGYEYILENNPGLNRSHFFQFGAKVQQETIYDKLNEWERLDSAGFSLPYNDQAVLVRSNIKAENDISSMRFTSYIMDSYSYFKPDHVEFKIEGGVRASYWNVNKELLFSPRLQLLYKPLSWSRKMSFKLASGLYVQPPFYREMRAPNGQLNRDIKAQKSLHAVLGMTYDFKAAFKRKIPLKFITEIYYKNMWDVISFEQNNVLIKYSGVNDAVGHAYGIDMRLNGELVPGAESWINVSFARAKERLLGIQHQKWTRNGAVETEFVNRPTNQSFALNVFFQDYLPKNENFKTHVNMVYARGLNFGVPNNNVVIRNPFRYKDYVRLDLGFSALLWDRSRLERRPHHPLRFTRKTWISLEIFNLLGVANVSGNTWIKDITNRQYAVQNRLTSRRVNLRLKMDF